MTPGPVGSSDTPDLEAAAAAVAGASAVVSAAARAVAATGGPDVDQVVAYDLAHVAAGVRAAQAALVYGATGTDEAPHRLCLRGRRTGRSGGAHRRARRRLRDHAGLARRRPGLRRRLPGRRLPRLAGRDAGRPPSRRGLRARARDVPPLRPGADPAARRAHPPRQRRHPRGDHHRPGRDGGAGPVDPRGVRRVRHRGCQRLPGHGGGHRGTVVGVPRRRWLADHPSRDPEPRPRGGGDRRAEAGVAAEAGIGRGHERGGGHRARLRFRRRRHRHRRGPHRRADGW